MGIDRIRLEKGDRINLEKECPGLKLIRAGLGWDANSSNTGNDFDLDASVFMLAADGKIPEDQYFVFYNNLKSPDGSVSHTGDNLTGEGVGDDETIKIDLSKIDSKITEVVFIVTIHKAEERRQNFGQVRNSYIKLYDDSNGKEIATYELDEDFSRETATEFGRLYKKDGQWRFQAVGAGFNSGLKSFVDKYCK